MKVIGTGAALPAQRVSSADIDSRLGKPQGWTFDQSGVRFRHVVQGESQIDLALTAARAALAAAKITPAALDLVIVASGIPYQTLPSTAPLVQRGLGLADGAVATFDINSTCLSFLTALETVEGLMRAGRYRTALIVSAEVASRALPWADHPEVAALFGDGAAAVVVSHLGPDLMATRFRTYPSAYEACEIGAGGTRFDFAHDRAAFEAHSRFAMDGRSLFRLTAAHFGGFVRNLLADAGVQPSEVDVVVPHQASPMALQHMIRLCGFDPAQVVDIVADVGNQIAASLPFALDHAVRSGRVRAGQVVVMLGTSAGVSFGGVVMEV